MKLSLKFFAACLIIVCQTFVSQSGFLWAQSAALSEKLQEQITESQRSQTLEEQSSQLKSKEDEKHAQFEEKVQDLGISEDGTADKPKKENDRKILLLKTLKFSQSDVLPADFFDALKQKYENQMISVNDIYEIVSAVNNEYTVKGYISSQAFLAKQDINSGTLFISLAEGIIDKVNVKGNKHTRESYIKRYINFENTDNLNANITNRQIMEFNASNDAKSRIALAPGEVFGTSDVDLIIEEPNLFSGGLFSDNGGQQETGMIRVGGFASANSLAGYRDILSLGGLYSEGSYAAYLNYEIPEPFFNARVGAAFNYSHTEIIKGDLKDLNVNGSYLAGYLYIKRPFFVRENAVTNAAFNIGTGNGLSYIAGYPTQDVKTDYYSFSVDNTLITNFGYFFNMLTYSQGFKLIDGETNFEQLSYYGEFFSKIYKTFGAVLKLKGQAAFETVPNSNQFSIGGANSVRGYGEGMLAGRDGVSINLEAQYDCDIIKWKPLTYLRGYAFFDYGVVYPDKAIVASAHNSEDIYSAGFGFKFGLFKYAEANLTCAFPLDYEEYSGVPKTKFLFYLQGKI